MITWTKLKTALLKARIAWHRRQANAYNRPVARSHRRDSYGIWLQNTAMRHAMKARDLEQKLGLAVGLKPSEQRPLPS